jgi:uncharacterized protein YegP (UPF0339 family)
MNAVVHRIVAAVGVVVVAAALTFGAAPGQDKKDTKKDAGVGKAAVIELYKDRGGEFRFRIKDADDVLLASSGKGYDDKAECLKVIEAIRKGAATAKLDDQTKAK